MSEYERTANFVFELDIELKESEMWPDGDAPENWTEDDVKTLVAQCGGPLRVLRDWDLDGLLSLSIYVDAPLADAHALAAPTKDELGREL